MTIIVRRRGLGKGSCEGFAEHIPELRVVRNDKLQDSDQNPTDIIRWGCTSRVPAHQDSRVFNNVTMIGIVNNKRAFRAIERMKPLTPKTWLSIDALINDPAFERYIPNGFIVRPTYHAQGRNLHVCTTPEALNVTCRNLGEGNYYISEKVNKIAEYRVFVCQNAAVWVANKIPGNPEAVAWNVAQGGRFENVRFQQWPISVVHAAVQAMQVINMDFGGVDIMVTPDGRALVLEINSAPSHTSPYRIECTAKAFKRMLEDPGHTRYAIGRGTEAGNFTFRDYIHPAVAANSRMTVSNQGF